MKKIIYIIPLLLIGILSQASCTKEDDDSNPTPNNNQNTTLTAQDKSDLIYMREEEKLARDVYLHSFDLYGLQIFKNISSSEQNHMDQILVLLEKYEVPDPASPDIGVFNDPDLQTLYNTLIAESEKSLIDALKVGATIEDLDIFDLKNAISKTEKSDIISTYELLWCGSRNHTRAYDSQIKKNGSTYIAQYISEAEYQDIISSAHEKCGQ